MRENPDYRAGVGRKPDRKGLQVVVGGVSLIAGCVWGDVKGTGKPRGELSILNLFSFCFLSAVFYALRLCTVVEAIDQRHDF